MRKKALLLIKLLKNYITEIDGIKHYISQTDFMKVIEYEGAFVKRKSDIELLSWLIVEGFLQEYNNGWEITKNGMLEII
jgi:hypothetical protein|tara:strand:- start:308 stop:544 length:237 start_codon:yes stop_codon:yes gene_type:complete